MNDVILKPNHQYIEICEMPEGELAGRTKIKMSALEIVVDNSRYNDNGISWLKTYVENNIESAISMPYVVSWFDEENQIPSDHGSMTYDDEGNVIFEGVSVGSVLDAYIEDIEIDGEIKTLLMTEGFLYKQRYPKFVEWLKEEVSNGKVYGSIEINGKGNSKIIEYLDGATNEDGSRKMGRIPISFDFTGLAILYLTNPADKSSIVFEVNSKEGENKYIPKNTIEINAMNYDDVSILVENEFNKKFNENNQYYSWFYAHKFYPTISTFIMKSWDKVGDYYKITYSIENGVLKIGDIIKVEEIWEPIGDIQSVEVNTPIRNIITNQKGGNDLKTIEELTAKVTELSTQLGEINAKVIELNSANEEKDSKIAELNTFLVEANKTLEETNAKCSTLEVECNSYKEEKAKIEAEKAKAEINTYFEVEIPKNNFEEAEINSLKEYVEKCDLQGLKQAEADLIVKKFKEGKLAVEVNVKKEDNLFFNTKEEKIDDVEAGKLLFV